jgi:hypothetical protein
MDIDDRKEEYSKHPLPGMGETGVSQTSGVEQEQVEPPVASNHTSSFVLSE